MDLGAAKPDRAHRDTVLNWGLESPQHPQAGKPAGPLNFAAIKTALAM